MKKIEFSRGVLWTVTTLIALFLIIPTTIVVPLSITSLKTMSFPPQGFSLQWYADVFQNVEWRGALANSFIVAIATTILSTLLGTSAALGISRLSTSTAAIALPLLLVPLVTPVIVFSIGVYMTFTKWGISNTLAGLVLAHTALGTPFVIVSVLASLRSLNRNLELASSGLGATPFFTFRRVIFPLILPGVVSGAIFAFITSWDEVVAALFLTSGDTKTVPVLIWSQVRAELSPSMAAVGTMLIVISAVVLLTSYKIMPTDQKR